MHTLLQSCILLSLEHMADPRQVSCHLGWSGFLASLDWCYVTETEAQLLPTTTTGTTTYLLQEIRRCRVSDLFSPHESQLTGWLCKFHKRARWRAWRETRCLRSVENMHKTPRQFHFSLNYRDDKLTRRSHLDNHSRQQGTLSWKQQILFSASVEVV